MVQALERWFRRLQLWWWKPILEEIESSAGLTAGLMAGIRIRLDGHETHLMAIGQKNGIPMATTKVPVARRWDCGHEHVSGSTDPGTGLSECVVCHQAQFERP